MRSRSNNYNSSRTVW